MSESDRDSDPAPETETVAVPRALLERLLDRVDDLEAELAEYRSANERDKATIRQQVTEVEHTGTDSPAAAESDENRSDTESMTPMERVLRFGQHGVTADVTASVRRAKTIAEHYKKWAKKTMEGYVIRDNLKTLLNTALRDEHDSVVWKQVYRAGQALEEFTKGAIRFEKHRKYGWILVADPDFTKRLAQLVKELDRARDQDRTHDRGRSSSVTGG